MESVLHFTADNSVLLLNGSFVQAAAAVRYEYNEPLFVTVLPLDAAYLPYTVEILGGKAVTNANLAVCCDMGGGHYYIELRPRYAYVYSPSERPTPKSDNLPARLSVLVQEHNYDAARTMLTASLNDSVSGDALADFFDGVVAVRENTFTPQKGYLLIKNDGTASRCDMVIKNGLIENIIMHDET